MELRLIREPTLDGATLGVLFVDGRYQCWTLEDAIREQKIPGDTAIPEGRYRIDITFSTRFQRLMPILLDVDQFSGIRIHSGNTIADTRGCLLVGHTRGKTWVGRSRHAMDALFPKLVAALDQGIHISIEPPMVTAPIASDTFEVA
jgi:hypothetical protein